MLTLDACKQREPVRSLNGPWIDSVTAIRSPPYRGTSG